MTLKGALTGMAAGAAGVAVMTTAEKFEQRYTKRPNSFVPSRTLAHLLRLSHPDEDRLARNHLMHWGTGILAGALRGLMAERGLRGPGASALHTGLRLTTDQSLENATGVGSPPWTWPRQELLIDVAHKAIYSFTTGWITDRLMPAPAPRSASTDARVVEQPPLVDDEEVAKVVLESGG